MSRGTHEGQEILGGEVYPSSSPQGWETDEKEMNPTHLLVDFLFCFITRLVEAPEKATPPLIIYPTKRIVYELKPGKDPAVAPRSPDPNSIQFQYGRGLGFPCPSRRPRAISD